MSVVALYQNPAPVTLTLQDNAINCSQEIGTQLHADVFPPNNDTIQGLALLRLAYLALRSSNVDKSPFTSRQLEILQISRRQNGYTVWGQRSFVVICSVVAAAVCFFVFIPVEDLLTRIIIAVTAAIVAVGTIGASFWATGFAPHSSSNAFNAQQDMLHAMERDYDGLAYRLVDYYFHENRTVASALADRIDCLELKETIARATEGTERADPIVARLNTAVRYIRSLGKQEELPEDAQFKHFILSVKAHYHV